MNGCFWTISQILMSWCQWKIQNNILKIILPYRIGNALCSENTKFYGNRVFKRGLTVIFKVKNLSNYWKKWLKSGQISKLFTNFLKYLKFEKYQIRERLIDTICWNNFLTYQRLILLYCFHQKISKEKTVNFGQAYFLHLGNLVSTYHA